MRLPILFVEIIVAVWCTAASTTTSTLAQNTQNFVLKPSDVRVRLGETALLKCSVSSRHGDVQWIHEGTALGYERQVAGKPRYSVTFGESEDTEYHLRIANVTLDDEGVFACQVAPVGDWDTKLEAKARLKVLVPPGPLPPTIAFNDESRHAGDIVHFRSASLKSHRFTCGVRHARPAALIKWYVNDTLASASAGRAVETKQADAAGYEDTLSVFELAKQANAIYNNSVLRCQAFHEAYGLEEQMKNMSVSLKVNILFTFKKDSHIKKIFFYLFFLITNFLNVIFQRFNTGSEFIKWLTIGRLRFFFTPKKPRPLLKNIYRIFFSQYFL